MRHLSIFTLSVLVTLLSGGCIAEEIAKSFDQSSDGPSVWVYAQFNVPEKDGIEDYYYYGRVSENIYDGFVDHGVKEGAIVLREVRYWSTDDEIMKYEDAMDNGTLVFRLEHLVHMRIQKGDPLLLEEESETSE